MSIEVAKYQLSVVSGGKPTLPHLQDASLARKNVSCLTSDDQYYVCPFNNQIKVFSMDTAHVVKTVKFNNHPMLTEIFYGSSESSAHHVCIADILLGDIVDSESARDNVVTLCTNTGYLVVINLKGKLPDTLPIFKLDLQEGEKLCKIFTLDAETLVLTNKVDENNDLTYRVYSFDKTLEQKLKLVFEISKSLLLTWSNNEKYMAVLYQHGKNKEHHVKVISLFENRTETSNIAITKVLPLNGNLISAKSKYVTSLTIDNQGSQLAFGFASGVISILSLTDHQTRLLKWHIDSVLTLSFSDDNMYLISGGWEKVISFWQLSTNLQQFLPRLNGIVIDSKILASGKYYAVGLQLIENDSNTDIQILILNSADLKSQICINGPLPVFNSPTSNVIRPISVTNTKISTQVSQQSILNKKLKRKLMKATRQDFTATAEINPLSKKIFFPHMSAIQSFDFYKNDQESHQYMASGTNNSMGKVRSELNIKEPQILDLKFTRNGSWMVTYEIEYPPQDLITSRDMTYYLKFWSKEENRTDWELQTKVVSPHGNNVPITKILASPTSVNDSNGFITTDNNGGLKYWAFNHGEQKWCLVKILLPNFNHFSNSVSLAWTSDGSLVFHAFHDKLQIIDFESFTTFDETEYNEFTLDSEIQSIKVMQDTLLIVATKTTLNTIDLLIGEVVNSIDIYPFVNGLYKNNHLDRLIACDEKNNRIAFVINERHVHGTSGRFGYSSKVIVFDSDLSNKLGIFEHQDYISWISWNYESDFIFLDMSSRMGVVGITINTPLSDETNEEGALDGLLAVGVDSSDFATQLQKLSESRRTAVIEFNTDGKVDGTLDLIEGEKKEKVINMNSFTGLFDNLQNVQLDTFFDRVMKVVT